MYWATVRPPSRFVLVCGERRGSFSQAGRARVRSGGEVAGERVLLAVPAGQHDRERLPGDDVLRGAVGGRIGGDETDPLSGHRSPDPGPEQDREVGGGAGAGAVLVVALVVERAVAVLADPRLGALGPGPGAVDVEHPLQLTLAAGV